MFDLIFSKETFDELYFSNDNLNYFKDNRVKRKFDLMVYGMFGCLTLFLSNILNSLLLILCLIFVMILVVDYFIACFPIVKQRKQLRKYYKVHSEPNTFKIQIKSDGFVFHFNDKEQFSKWNDIEVISNNDLYVSFKSDINYLVPAKCMVENEFKELRNYLDFSNK